ncbi:hypothetical protein QTP70_030289 [Hemibagrus guttatus]|uniref:Uncharacterized protein n=1 Tax=Hemibagrus guttatus TaxID=175788 RepID=A0AAE0Q159_9TELE|nr:hypothetical protein QTP70_030289 [Hemibagrus guttatus]KAK3530606.1 hypothetical protein QTP86_028862 [Hemibagrus guttatus]
MKSQECQMFLFSCAQGEFKISLGCMICVLPVWLKPLVQDGNQHDSDVQDLALSLGDIMI